ncbi:MAG: hypothetical protein KDB58_07220 [Solirubrobacterales bacterium]|nr:hypothetical protein [Solirubrobacterales bacterium]MCB9617781.1 hypothetical protein [Sandaracinus sp.]
MRRRLPGIDAELSAAVKRVAEVYVRCPDTKPDVCGERFHERQVDRACAGTDRPAAMRAIEAWEQETITVLSRCLLDAPLKAAA